MYNYDRRRLSCHALTQRWARHHNREIVPEPWLRETPDVLMHNHDWGLSWPCTRMDRRKRRLTWHYNAKTRGGRYHALALPRWHNVQRGITRPCQFIRRVQNSVYPTIIHIVSIWIFFFQYLKHYMSMLVRQVHSRVIDLMSAHRKHLVNHVVFYFTFCDDS